MILLLALRTTCTEHQRESKWDLRIVENSFSPCTSEAWINDTARFQVILKHSMNLEKLIRIGRSGSMKNFQ